MKSGPFSMRNSATNSLKANSYILVKRITKIALQIFKCKAKCGKNVINFRAFNFTAVFCHKIKCPKMFDNRVILQKI